MHRLVKGLIALLALAVPASAGAATPVSLPTVHRTLTAGSAVRRTCSNTADASARGVTVSHYTAPISGYVTGRLSGPATSDWDLVAVDRASHARMASSSAFGSNEVVQAWATGGQKIDFLACRRSGRARSVALSIELVDVKPPAAATGSVSLVRVRAARGQIASLAGLGLDVTESQGPGWADVLLSSPSALAKLQSTHLPFSVRVANMSAYETRARAADAAYTAKVGAAGSPLPSGRTTYRTYADIQNDLKALVDKYPTLVKPVTIGQTFQGRDITGVEITKDVNAKDGKPDFFLMGEHHAREWPSAEIPLEYADMLVENQSDPRVASLLDRERTTIVPVVNVDGYLSTQQDEQVDPSDTTGQNPTVETGEDVAPPGGILAFRRKNCDGAIPSGDVPCELQWGVDNNRNYGNLWGGPGSSQDPTSQSFHGPSPRSEPETQAVWNYSRTHQVTALISLHTIAALVLRPPGEHTAGLAPDENAMKTLGDAMGNATGYTSEYGFQLYDTAGTTEDDTYAAEGGYGYTIEMGPVGGVFHGPYQQYVVDQWTTGDKGHGGLHEALLLAAEAAASRPDHGVITGNAPAGAVLKLHKAFDTTTSPYCPIGVDPVVTVTATPDQLSCPGGVQDPQTLKDTFDTTMTVPSSGTYSWDVNPSTRPFVGGGATINKLADKPTRELTTTGGGPSTDNLPTQGVQTYPFTINPDDPGLVKVDVSWPTPEDYDIVVNRINADGSKTAVGSSGNGPGTPEEVV
ncbi:MAG: cpt, partial [Solirubrobacteraceae bacterium]|nr:cpt [Solirubrobacteraceae bacterium]